MPRVSTSADYKSDLRPDNPARPAAGPTPRAVATPAPNQATADTVSKPGDFHSVEEFLQLLARAVRQFHTYPATSPLCTEAIAGCYKTLTSLAARDRISFSVTPRELIVDEIKVGAGTIIEQELVRRLHRAHVAGLDIERGASARDLSRFCSGVARSDSVNGDITLGDLLTENGVTTIVPRLAYRPQVLQVGAPQPPVCELVEHERNRQLAGAGAGPVSYLYPPDKGWVRLDPAAAFDSISLLDLAVMVDDPGEVATMLLRLTDDEAGSASREHALQQKFSDVSMLFSSLDPRLARVMFSKLARAVLDLEPDRRKDLLKRTILPALLDGRADGTVLRDFPDVDLTESLCLLLDLETAAPEVVTTALDRLELPADRRQTLAPLLEARMRGEELPDTAPPDPRGRGPGVDRHARRLIRIDAAAGKDFAEFAAFDLSIDDQTAAALGHINAAIGETDLPLAHFRFLLGLVRLETNPVVVEVFLQRAATVFSDFERAGRLQELADGVAEFRRLGEQLQPTRPDVADLIAGALGAFCTPARAVTLADLYTAGGDGRALANRVMNAFGPALAVPLAAVLDDPALNSRARGLVPLMCDHAKVLGPALASRLGHCGIGARRAIVKVLGFTGTGYENALAGQVGHADEQTSREAMRALAQIGSTQAAALVGTQLRDGAPSMRAAAEEALRHFPPGQAAVQLNDLLGRREFIIHNPELAMRLLDRAAQIGSSDLEAVMRTLAALRFRFWNPALMRVANRARTLLQR